MSVDLHIDIENTGKVAPALQKGMEEGFEDAGEWMLENGEETAKDIVLNTERVWRGTLKSGFSTNSSDFNRYNRWSGEIRNDAKHAKIVEKGLAPAGEITGSTPSVQDILPWVDTEVVPNAAAQEKADNANIGNWDVQLQALAVQYGKANVITAFAIANSIKDDGYPGIRFMDQTESHLESQAVNVKHKVESKMQRAIDSMVH